MRIIIIGCGRVGYTLAENLSSEDHDVTIIDNNESALISAAENLDVMYLKGNGASLSTLNQADAQHAGVVIAVTLSDEVNMLCCVMSKKLGVKHTVARIRDPEYMRDYIRLKQLLDIDLIINPERSTASEILRLLRFPSAVEIDTFYRGRVELIGFRVVPDDGLDGLSVIDLRKKNKAKIQISLAEQGGVIHIPRGDFVIHNGDLLYVAGKYTDVTSFFRNIGRARSMAGSVMILGGGRTAYYLAQMAANVKIKPLIIEYDGETCLRHAETLPHATVINGDGTDQELLESENIRGMDAFVALGEKDEENLIISLFAVNCGVRKVVTKLNQRNYIPLVNSLGLESIISLHEITTTHILHFVRGLLGSRGGAVVSVHRLLDGKVEALEFTVKDDMRNLGKALKDLPIKRGVLIAVISRGGKSIIPEGNDAFMEGDNVVIVTTHAGFDELNDIFER